MAKRQPLAVTCSSWLRGVIVMGNLVMLKKMYFVESYLHRIEQVIWQPQLI